MQWESWQEIWVSYNTAVWKDTEWWTPCAMVGWWSDRQDLCFVGAAVEGVSWDFATRLPAVWNYYPRLSFFSRLNKFETELTFWNFWIVTVARDSIPWIWSCVFVWRPSAYYYLEIKSNQSKSKPSQRISKSAHVQVSIDPLSIATNFSVARCTTVDDR